MKKALKIALMLAMVLMALSACGSNNMDNTASQGNGSSPSAAASQPSATPSESAKPSVKPSPSPSKAPEPSDSKSSSTPSPTPDDKPKTEFVVEIKDFAFSPANLTVPKGSTVKFINRDKVKHSAVADGGEFDTGLLALDDSASVKFNDEGTFSYYCGPHQNMTAKPNLYDTSIAQSAPTKIETLFHLTASRDTGKFTDHPRAYGVACLVRSERQDQFVVYVFGTPQTEGSEAYQVWVWNEGQRHSAGTFTVDASGIGIMTIPVTEKTPAIEYVSVSLEPDQFSDEPKGTRMFEAEERYSAGQGLQLATIRSHLLG
ncbi:anti-sigma factor domain-containing protein [Cohnella kolymensis]|uniref:anti-sigma factor domain-containing protein n=1 Tax=Cohnella kolymensis TaxID=1590652 RepID=UPI0013792FF7|nr:anti-sigma factor [Cohnella kolymensis]